MLELAGIQVDAVSVAGMETCIQLKQYGLCFDIGRCPRTAVRLPIVLITHAHIDHLGGIAQHVATRSLVSMPPPTYVMPAEIVKPVEHLLDAWRALDGSTLPCTLVGTRPGDEWSPRPDLLVRTFRSHHPVVTQGYVLIRRKKKLHPDLRGLSQNEIREKRLAGEPVDFFVETPEVAFTGDSRIEVFDHEPDLYRARLLLMEVTFLDDRIPPEKARSRGHIHLDDVLERAEHFENEAILFTHLSARYSPTEALAILEKRLPAGLRDRVTLLLPPPEYKTRL